jgi:DNA primase
MNGEQLEEVVRDLGFTNIRVVHTHNDTNIMVNCPFHGESHPSCGISAEKEIGGCFACGQTFTLPYFISYVNNWSMKQAYDYLEEKFNVKKQTINEGGNKIRRIDESNPIMEGRVTIPLVKLAPYKSGKITHKYLLDRGFTAKTFQRFKLGWDAEKQRVTIPIFWEDDTLAGFLGRAVLNDRINGKKSAMYKKVYGDRDKYLVYEFERSKILYPLNMLEIPEDGTIILVEGSLDAIWMHQYGFTNTLAILTSKLSHDQKELLNRLGVKRIVLMLDNDEAGEEGMEKAYKMLKKDFVCYRVTYPKDKNDPQELTKEEITEMLDNKAPYRVLNPRRIE